MFAKADPPMQKPVTAVNAKLHQAKSLAYKSCKSLSGSYAPPAEDIMF